MKIAVVAQALDTHSGCRVEIELSKQFRKFGHEVLFFAHQKSSKTEVKKDLEKLGVKVVLIKSPEIKIIGPVLGGLKLAKKLKREKADIISSHTTLPFLAGAKLSGIPIVATYYGTQLDVWYDKIFPKPPNLIDRQINNILNGLIKLYVWLQMIIPNHIVTQTSYCSSELKKFYGKKAPFVFWGALPTTFDKIKSVSKNGKEIRLLSVSRFVPYKRFHLLIEVIQNLNLKFDNLKVTFVGSHPNRKYLTYLKKIKPENIEIVEEAEDQKLAAYYRKSDIYFTGDKFLFFGEPVFEAASFGKPTVALDSAAAQEVVFDGKTGFVCKTNEEFKAKLTRLIQSPKLREKLGKNAQEIASQYTWERCAKSYFTYFERWKEK